VSVGGVRFEMHVQTRYWLDSVLFRTGTWEEADARCALSFLRPGGHAVDVGANAGVYTLAFARAVGPRGRVLAIEPGSEACARLRDNIRHNGLQNVDVVQAAAAATAGSLTLHLSAIDLGSSSCVHPPSPHEHAGQEAVTAIALDDAIAQGGLAPDLIKIDVEGMEVEALRGAERVLRARRPVLMVEINADALQAAATSPAELVAALYDLGYRVRTAHGGTVTAENAPTKGWVNVFAVPGPA
jgi:FkbM family methyltransferase